MNVEPKFIVGQIDEKIANHFFQNLVDPEYVQASEKQFLISSPGGDVGYMLSMFDQIRIMGATTIGSGILQSAAAVLLQAGKIRKMTRNSLLVFHEPEKRKTVLPAVDGRKEKVVEEIPQKDWTLYTHLVGLVADRTGMSEIEAYDIFDGKFITPEKAKTLNLIDEIIDPKVIPVYQPNFEEGSGDDTSN